MGAACCSENGRCHRPGAAAAEGEIGCSPPAPEDGVSLGPSVVARPSAAPGRGGDPLQGRARPRGADAAARGPSGGGGPSKAGGPGEEDLASELTLQTDLVPGPADCQQQREAKVLIKGFVKDMVKGKDVNVLAPSGDLKRCSVSLNRSLDTLKIKMGSASRRIALTDLDEIHAGAEDVEDINTPLDELCATLFLSSGDAISFRLVDIEERDTFILCLTMFADKLR